ncbi:MAG: DNA replication and repair protein RecF, partial [Bacillota bacterium]|nr:DNA replication and repair protein RecF [Bacillota bacterium]
LIPTIDIWNQRLCEYGARLVMYRDSFSKLLEKYCCQNMLDLTSGAERLEITYVPSVRYKDPLDIKDIKESFLKRMEELKTAELARGQALTGPHRDDLEFYINGNNAKVFASQGQQRSVVLCIKIAMVDIIKDRTGEYPVLLLDDIMSELDKSRQAYLTERIKGKQTIITCTETAHLRKSKRVSFFKVENGRFIEKPALQTINK